VPQIWETPWVQIRELIGLINQMPPPSVLEGRIYYFRNFGEKKNSAQEMGVPVRKGKVRRRENGA
jgi:hypothetical protein